MFLGFLGSVCAAPAQNPRNLLIEFQTGTLCGYCPCADSIIEKVILVQYPNTVVLAYHAMFNDPYQFFIGNEIRDSLKLNNEPMGSFDRIAGNLQYEGWADTAKYRYTQSPSSPILMHIRNKSFDPVSRELTISVDLVPETNLSGDYRINFVLAEDNLVYQQSGHSDCPGGRNYVHRWVTRSMMNTAIGDSLHYGSWNALDTIRKTFHYTLDSIQWIADNCNIVAFVYKLSSQFQFTEIQQAVIQGLTRDLGVGKLPDPGSPAISVYPNPVSKTCNIHISVYEEKLTVCKLHDMNGKEVMQLCSQDLKPGLYNIEFDAGQLAEGTYDVILISGNRKAEKKIIVVK